ncbi:unnamed protein product [Ostreobium quekettii]|uniref:Uncharacterized protein n=1 Tax=Ostreobium quekettii TaxID=121088 RepID=A0A8S1IR32_9CHLO|nr:unnamed protein product [Ostreobium quekettii]
MEHMKPRELECTPTSMVWEGYIMHSTKVESVLCLSAESAEWIGAKRSEEMWLAARPDACYLRPSALSWIQHSLCGAGCWCMLFLVHFPLRMPEANDAISVPL